MASADEPAAGQPTHLDEDPQDAVARARENVLRGYGPGASKAEYDRYKRERPTLGALPSPLARELVHLQTAWIRSSLQRGVDDTVIQNQLDRVREVWLPKPADHPRTVAMEQTLNGSLEDVPAQPPRSATPCPVPAASSPAAGRVRYAAAVVLGAVVGAVLVLLLQRYLPAARRV